MVSYKQLSLSKMMGCLLLTLSAMSIPVIATAEVNPTALQKSSAESVSASASGKTGVVATGIKLGFVIEKIELIKTAERFGDELYFSVAQYSTVDKPKILNLPEPPMHWLSKHIDKIKNVIIWKKSVVDQEKVKLSISFVEMDNPPWNPDDLNGVIDLEIKNDKGNISVKWNEPKKENAIDAEQSGVLALGTSQTIEVKGNGSDYKITFKVRVIE